MKWNVEKSAACCWGYGGKVDLHNDKWIIDFKTKPFGPDDKPLKTWDEHHMQLAAYDLMLGKGRRAAIIFISTTHPGLCQFVEISEVEMERGLKMFLALVDFWQAKTGYKP